LFLLACGGSSFLPPAKKKIRFTLPYRPSV
jgi:hypothetical protein